MVEPDFDPDFEPGLLDEIDQMMDVVNFVVQVQAYHRDGYSELWFRQPLTGRMKRIFVLSLPN